MKRKKSLVTKEIYSALSHKPSQQLRPDTSSASEMLTPSEIEQLQQEKKELADYNPKAFAHLKKE